MLWQKFVLVFFSVFANNLASASIKDFDFRAQEHSVATIEKIEQFDIRACTGSAKSLDIDKLHIKETDTKDDLGQFDIRWSNSQHQIKKTILKDDQENEVFVCFPTGTLICVKDTKALTGYSLVAVEDVNLYDLVVSCNFLKPQERQYRRIIGKAQFCANKVMKLTAGKKEIKATEHHLIFASNKNAFIEIKDLSISDLLRTIHGENIAIDNISVEHGHFTVYNLEVEEEHNYYAEEILVHNKEI